MNPDLVPTQLSGARTLVEMSIKAAPPAAKQDLAEAHRLIDRAINQHKKATQ